MARELHSVGDVIDALGGATAVAAITKRKQPAVSNWKKRGHFPSDTYLTIGQALLQIGKTAPPSLFRMNPVSSRRGVSQTVKSMQAD